MFLIFNSVITWRKPLAVSQYSFDLLLVSMFLIIANGAPKKSYIAFTLVQAKEPTTADNKFHE